jgi:hypothetical protein
VGEVQRWISFAFASALAFFNIFATPQCITYRGMKTKAVLL